MRSFLFILFSLVISTISFCQENKIDGVEPPFWWVGMQNTDLQLMVYEVGISEYQPIIDHKGVTIEKVIKVESPNYLFINLELDKDVKPGIFKIEFKSGEKLIEYDYELKSRVNDSAEREGFNSSDLIYLITPDRFANGDPDNDNVDGYYDKLNRQDPYGRHGGDIKGLIDNLDYIIEMGYTAIWLNPILENNQNEQSYHGYATTDYYKVDPRYGSNEDYQRLSALAEEKGVKIIMDMIANHCGSQHWWMEDLPTKDWLNYQEEYQITNHRKSTLVDPYVSSEDRKLMVDGWYVPTMPDLNQRNKLMSKY